MPHSTIAVYIFARFILLLDDSICQLLLLHLITLIGLHFNDSSFHFFLQIKWISLIVRLRMQLI